MLEDKAHLLPQEVADLQRVTTVLDDTVDREMGIHRTHLVLEALSKKFASARSLR